MSEMKPCPFCGSKDVGVVIALGEGWGKCNNCGSSGPMVDSADCDKSARKAWDKRK